MEGLFVFRIDRMGTSVQRYAMPALNDVKLTLILQEPLAPGHMHAECRPWV